MNDQDRTREQLLNDLRALSRRLLDVQEAERRHLSRELHDEIGQQLTCLRLLLKPLASRAPDALRPAWDETFALLDGLLARVREVLSALRPPLLDELGLLPALHALVDGFRVRTGVLVDFRHGGLARRFAPEVETAAYRIVQEGLTNVARHAGAGAAVVSVRAGSDVLEVQVEDRGGGFDPCAVLAAARGNGLGGMAERCRLLGGHLAVDAAPGKGTHLTARLPLAGGAGAEGP
jgi:signal transduction histidine kinase